MPGEVMAGSVLTAGLRNTFAATYRMKYEGVLKRLGETMLLEVPSDKLVEIYGYFLTAPYPVRWQRGNEISAGGFGSTQFTVENFDWGKRISWNENDREDDQTGTLFDQAKSLGAHFATLPERVFFQILTNLTDPDLLPAIPNAPDGVALFSGTDGSGANRFGRSTGTGGNIVSQTGVANINQVRADFFSLMEMFVSFQDTEGQPLWDPGELEQGVVLLYNHLNSQIFAEAFQQSRPLQILMNVAGAENVAAAAVSNIIQEANFKFVLGPTPRITDNKWYGFLRGTEKKPIFQQLRRGNREAYATFDNSDSVRKTKEEYFQIDNRAGYGVALPYAAGAVQ